MISRRLATFTKVGAVTLLLGALSFSSTASAVPSAVALSLPEKVQRMLSQGALARWYAQHPEQVSAGMRARPDWIAALGARVNAVPRALAPGDFPMRRALFNRDDLGLPQNEESVDRCSSNGNLVLAGTNDYRGLLNPLGNFTGWHFSDNGATLTREGLLPAVTFADGVAVPSSGDPGGGLRRGLQRVHGHPQPGLRRPGCRHIAALASTARRLARWGRAPAVTTPPAGRPVRWQIR